MFTQDLLRELLAAVHFHLGVCRFEEAQFTGNGVFRAAQFTGEAWFVGAEFKDEGEGALVDAQFEGEARFERACFGGAAFMRAKFARYAAFDGATFSGGSAFDEARFAVPHGRATFNEATFEGDAFFYGVRFAKIEFQKATFTGDDLFRQARFNDVAVFEPATFNCATLFEGATFRSPAFFSRARFTEALEFGPAVSNSTINLSDAVFQEQATIQVAAKAVGCNRTRWASKATLRLRYATLGLRDAELWAPVAVVTHPARFTTVPDIGAPEEMDETVLAAQGRGYVVRVASVQGVDAAHLLLTDIDLSECAFFGAFHLDQIHLEGRCTFALPPHHEHSLRCCRFRPRRWTHRQTLAEEHHWRALSSGNRAPSQGWKPSPNPDRNQTAGPEDVVVTYRALRKAFEDGKNEPDAADFYYGEMEMRRHDKTRPRAERFLLWLYWLLSGYGLRASRAIAALLATMSLSVLLLMAWGLPQDTPKPETTGRLTGQEISLVTDTPDPKPPTDPWHDPGKRFEKALQITLNSVIFRSSGQDLTTFGTYTEMATRLVEPVLLGLAVLAVRGRVKR